MISILLARWSYSFIFVVQFYKIEEYAYGDLFLFEKFTIKLDIDLDMQDR